MKNSCCKVLAGSAIGLASLTMFALLSLPLEAQTFYGSVVGTVTDPSGAVVPGAKVTLTNMATKGKHTAQTDAAGNYRFVNLVRANYRLEAEVAGFKRTARELISQGAVFEGDNDVLNAYVRDQHVDIMRIRSKHGGKILREGTVERRRIVLAAPSKSENVVVACFNRLTLQISREV